MAQKNSNFLENSIIIAAHPDDEILWFSSIMEKVNKVIIIYQHCWAEPEIGEKRAAAVAELPHPNVQALAIPEAGTYGCANWQNPVLSDVGLAFGFQEKFREIKRRIKIASPIGAFRLHTPRQSIAHNYRENYSAIYQALEKELSAGMNVFTHNPWGEYGHEDHVQVFRVVDKLRQNLGFTQWMSNYCTNRSLPLAKTYFDHQPSSYFSHQTDKSYADKVADIYRKHGCWTWSDNWQWFEEDSFMEAPHQQANAKEQAHLFPLNLFSI